MIKSSETSTIWHVCLVCLIPFFISCQNSSKEVVDNDEGSENVESSISNDVWIDKNEDENYTPRHECSFVQIGDEFIMFGGRENSQRLDKYDYKANSWSAAKNKAPKEFNHFQATAYKGFIWIIGSFKTNDFPRELPEENVWLYFPPTDQWIQGPEIPEDRRRGGAGLVMYEDKFYVVGGNTIGHDGGYVNWFDEYDPWGNTWTELENASQQRDHFHAALIGTKLYAVAGRKSGGPGGVFSPLPAIVDVYDFETKTWTTLKDNIPTPRAAPGIAVFNDELFVMGGEGEEKGPAYKIVEVYSPVTDSWSTRASMNYPRHGTQALISGKGIYMASGSPKRGGGNQHNMEVYSEDAPDGRPLVPSDLDTPADVSIEVGASKKIQIKNTGGNTGTFITSVELTAEKSDQFKITSNNNLTLVDVEGTLSIDVQHLGKAGETAALKIIYNGNREEIIKLSGIKMPSSCLYFFAHMFGLHLNNLQITS